MRLTISGYSKDPARAEAKQNDLKRVCNFYLLLQKSFGHTTKELKSLES